MIQCNQDQALRAALSEPVVALMIHPEQQKLEKFRVQELTPAPPEC